MDDQQPATVPTERAPEPIETPQPLPRRRKRWVAGIAAATTVLALGGVGGYAVGERVPPTARPRRRSRTRCSATTGASSRTAPARGLSVGGRSLATAPRPDTGTTANASQTSRPGADRVDARLPGRRGGRHRHGPHLRRRGGHQPPRRRRRHHGQGDRDEHGQDVHRDGGRHRHQGRRGRAPARRRQRAHDGHHRQHASGRGRRRDRGRRRQRHRGPPQRRHRRGDGPRRADHHAERGQRRGTDAHRADRDQQRRDLRRLRRRDVRRAGRGASG